MTRLILTALISVIVITAYAQHDHGSKPATPQPSQPMTFNPVLTQALSDVDLKGYTLESMVMSVVPLGTDTVAHRHDCDLFGYVLEGEVQIGLEKKEPKTFVAGQMFYEPRNVLHSLARNPSKDKGAKVLLLFLLKDGRVRYTVEYPVK
jgi:quercetin dioxygenase-like cupin family protein